MISHSPDVVYNGGAHQMVSDGDVRGVVSGDLEDSYGRSSPVIGYEYVRVYCVEHGGIVVDGWNFGNSYGLNHFFCISFIREIQFSISAIAFILWRYIL